jgi:hypothetical protein
MAVDVSPERTSGSPDTSSLPRVRLDGTTLVVPPLRIVRHGMAFGTHVELRVNLEALGSFSASRVYAVHNFHAEDTNPDLDEGVLGIYVGFRRDDGTWEEPESFPIECRALAVLCDVQRSASGRLAIAPRGAVPVP